MALARFHHDDFYVSRLIDAKRLTGTSVSVCIPAHDEETTVGRIVASIRSALVDADPLIDELIVIDDASTDATAAAAADAGADVVSTTEVLPEIAAPGKGRALWKSLHVSTGDLVAWCDADITDFEPHFVAGLVGPMLVDPTFDFVKGTYARAVDEHNRGGGRVTELVARPLIAMLHPGLSEISQPLAGEYAGRRSVLERVPFVGGYGVEMGLLIDLLGLVGIEAFAEVDLGRRTDRNRPLHRLAPQAVEVAQIAMRRADADLATETVTLRRPDHDDVVIDLVELPPMIDEPTYRRG